MDQSSPPAHMEAERVNELARNFWYSAILRAAIKLDVFSLLEDQELTHGQGGPKPGRLSTICPGVSRFVCSP